MKFVFSISLCLLFARPSFAQKPVLDDAALAEWPRMGQETISNDGNYVLCCIDSYLYNPTLYLRSTMSGFTTEIPSVRYAAFTEDSHRVIYVTQGDSLCILELGSNKLSVITGVKSFKIPENGGQLVVAYELMEGDLVLYRLQSGEKTQYDHVSDYSFSKGGKVLLVFQKWTFQGQTTDCLRWIDIKAGQSAIVWRGEPIIKYVFDSEELKLAFIVGSSFGNVRCEIRVFEIGKDSIARVIVNHVTPGIQQEYAIGKDKLQFSPDGQRLFFGIYRIPDTLMKNSKAASVDIWNYQDDYLQCDQLATVEADKSHDFLAVVDLSKNKVLQLEGGKDGLWGQMRLNDGDKDNYLLTETNVNIEEGLIRTKDRPDVYLVNTKDGSRLCVVKQLLYGDVSFSPGGKYVVWYDLEKRSYITYNIQKRTIKNISKKIPLPVYNNSPDRDGLALYFPYGCGVWTKNDEGLLIYDRYDIWQVDPEGEKDPVDITNGYGRNNKIVFRSVYFNGRGSWLEQAPVRADDVLLLCAFDERNKNNGFFQKKLGIHGDPHQLSMGPYCFYFSANFSFVGLPQFLLKARDTSKYLVERMSATEYPNLQFTNDFKTFYPVTALAPEKRINWLTSELIRWKTFDGRPGEGILYKPENFDSSRKYPIILYFYERLSAGLNQYIQPDWSSGAMNIPWFVSRGYLVFCPDIYYTQGNPGRGIYNFVVSAAEMMGKKAWVDSLHMGIQGHSFGGYEVNYLVTRTRKFAAAASASGFTDIVSSSGEAGFGNCARQVYTEFGQLRMGEPLCKDPLAYIKNSPVFGVGKVGTPLLIMHCKNDGGVPWSQGVEFFIGLRRLGKPCFLLQYDQGGHSIGDIDAIDYTKRLTQFFDHYLKKSPAPKWMAEGIPARLKGIDSGLEVPSLKTLAK